MFSSKAKALVLVGVLLMVTGFLAVGCRAKAGKGSMVNSDTLPGHRYSKYVSKSNARQGNSNVVYLGSDDTSGVEFGPKDVSFEFKALK